MNAPADGPPELTTTALGGGLSARLVALAVAGSLVAVVWIGMSDRSGPSAAPIPVAQDQRSTPPITTPTPQASPTDDESPSPPATASPTPVPSVRYVATGTVGGQVFSAELVEARLGYWTGEYWLPDPPSNDDLTFTIVVNERTRAWTWQQVATLGTWTYSLAELAGNHRAGREAVSANAQGRPRLLGAPLPIESGYELHVSVRLAFNEVVVVYIEIGLRPRRQLRGDDGIMGWPTSAGLARSWLSNR